MKTDVEVQADVSEELLWETRVDPEEIGVTANHGRVTLRGTVGSLGAKRAAEEATKRVDGVRGVQNELEVRLLTGHRRDDAELRGTVLKALSWNVFVPDSVDASVTDGVVTLTGIVDHRHQRDEAARTTRNLYGVVAVHDEIKVKNPGMAAEVSERLEQAFARSAQIDANGIRIKAVDDRVTLDGTVKSWAEHDAALEAAWATPGVTDVEDELEIGY